MLDWVVNQERLKMYHSMEMNKGTREILMYWASGDSSPATKIAYAPGYPVMKRMVMINSNEPEGLAD